MTKRTYIAIFLAGLKSYCLIAQESKTSDVKQQSDNEGQDSVYIPQRTPTYIPEYRFGDPISNRVSRSPLFLKDPSKLDFQVQVDTSGVSYSIYEKINGMPFRPATTMSFQEFDDYTTNQLNKMYWKEQSEGADGESAVSARRLVPKLYISPVFDRIFGGDYIDIKPNGFATLDFGGRWQFVDNSSIPERQRRNGGFNFDMQLSTNVVGKVGEKLAVTFNYDNNNSFDFQNDIKMEYTGYEEDIIKKLEIGNVSMPVKNSLIQGTQSLFGIKTQLQFGKLYVTAIASEQRGKNESISTGCEEGYSTSGGGNNGNNINVQTSRYDENKHFFLGHYFRDNYEKWHGNLPMINSGLMVRRVEVYVINRNNETTTNRSFVAFTDLGESDASNINNNTNWLTTNGNETDNSSNNIFQNVEDFPRDKAGMKAALENLGYSEEEDYLMVNQARRLDDSEFTINKDLGYISLVRRLASDEALAVSYEYAINGKNFKVGEMTEDYQNRADEELIILKLLRPNQVATQLPTWDLMMKNIYYLGTSGIEQQGFTLRIMYRDDRTGQDNPSLHEGQVTKDQPLLQLLGLDRLNNNNDQQSDGNFDFIPEKTIDTRSGLLKFPVLEPFGSNLRELFNETTEADLIQKYVYQQLYDEPQANAELISELNKFVLIGNASGQAQSTIPLPGFNISPGSVIVTAGGTLLSEGLHYDVDYLSGQVIIRDDAILKSGKCINISFEKADVFNVQTRWLTGLDLDYRVNDQFNIGASILRLNERAGAISRFAVGDEPSRNTKYGWNINWQDEIPLLTKIIDALPLISTKEPSDVSFSAEMAQIVPGTSNLINGEGTSFIDDFEDSAIPSDLSAWSGWKLAATPETSDEVFIGTSNQPTNDLRSKIAWYNIDNSVFFSATNNNRPSNLSEQDLQNHYVRAVEQQEIFTERDIMQGNPFQRVLDVAFYPSERGQYNYSPLRAGVEQVSSQQNRKYWGGISRATTNNVNFSADNVEYLEFWLLNPFITDVNGIINDGTFGRNNNSGGVLVFNLGNISEDVMDDDLHAFENGLPVDGDPSFTTEGNYGRVTTEAYLTDQFVNEASPRSNQDVGLDGLKDVDEKSYSQFAPQIRALDDPSADNFRYYLSDEYDALDAKILQRYKDYNGMDGNTPVSSNNGFTPASTQTPDNEDLNDDNTISSQEDYFEYRIPLSPNSLNLQNKFIVDQVETVPGAKWYLFRIPIQNRDNYTTYNNPTFDNIKFIRMYLTDFSEPVVLRFAKFRTVRSQWRKSTNQLDAVGLNEIPEPDDSQFDVSYINVEESGSTQGEEIPYVVPPGLSRDINNNTTLNQRINEQALQLCVDDLEEGNARAVYKTNILYDLINYGRIKMFFHLHSQGNSFVSDDEITGFIRLGTDENLNFYEIELPLKVTTAGSSDPQVIWPNEIDIQINELLGLKSQRNRTQLTEGLDPNLDSQIPFKKLSESGVYTLTVKGNPDISRITTLIIGIRNVEDNNEAKSFCIWANELRVTDFDSQKGWAANARLNMKLADLGIFSANTRYTSVGFGSIHQKIAQRTRKETFEYDVSAQINLEKFMRPDKTGLRIPMFASYQESRSTPKWDPLDPDIPLEAVINTFENNQEKKQYLRIVEDRSIQRSLNFTNVGKSKVNPDASQNIYDIENFSFSYAYSDTRARSVSQQSFVQKTVLGGLSYNYSFPNFSIEPFAKIKVLKSPYLGLIREINFSPLPSNISFRADLNRNFTMTQLYNDQLTTEGIDPYYQRLFNFTRNYSLRWALFKGLSLDYNARTNAVIDEPETTIEGDIDTKKEKDFIWNQIKGLGRMKDFSQDISANFKIPLDKMPLTDWIIAEVRYNTSFNWRAGFVGTAAQTTQVIPAADDEDFFGNFISNSRNQSVNGRFDLLKLYNKSKFLKKVNATPKKSRVTSRRPSSTNDEKDYQKKEIGKVSKGILRLFMSLRSLNASYSIREATTLPGFLPTPHLMGLDSGFNAPGWPFVLGSQNADIRIQAAQKGWLTKNILLTAPFDQSKTADFSLSAVIEPASDIKIKFDAKQSNSGNYQEIFRYDTLAINNSLNGYESLTPSRGGSYNITTLTIATAFEKQIKNSSPAFDQFKKNIPVIQERLNRQVEAGQYEANSQDVLIPAFLAAYTGKDENISNTSPFPKIPIPNWRLDYAGLSKLDILKDMFSSINITHGYRSIYSVNNYTNSLQYVDNLEVKNSVLDYPIATESNDEGNLIPVFVINQVTISEQFTPLIGINLRTKTNLTTRMEYKKDRNLSLNLSNAQIAETKNSEFSFELGINKDKLKLPWKARGRTITIENDISFRVNLALRDSKTIQRNIDGLPQVTNGNLNVQIRPTASYRVNKMLDLTAYFDRTVTKPRAGSIPRTATAFGIQLRLNFAQ